MHPVFGGMRRRQHRCMEVGAAILGRVPMIRGSAACSGCASDPCQRQGGGALRTPQLVGPGGRSDIKWRHLLHVWGTDGVYKFHIQEP